jgi:hypothetical protein
MARDDNHIHDRRRDDGVPNCLTAHGFGVFPACQIDAGAIGSGPGFRHPGHAFGSGLFRGAQQAAPGRPFRVLSMGGAPSAS